MPVRRYAVITIALFKEVGSDTVNVAWVAG